VTINNTGGTDHLAFDAVGLPGFQFIQDPIEYSTRTWHTTQDVSDRILEQDVKRSAVIMATFAYNTAMMDERLPRKAAAQPGGLAALFTGYDVRAMMEDAAFRGSNLDFSVCGRDIEAHELPQGFPKHVCDQTHGSRSCRIGAASIEVKARAEYGSAFLFSLWTLYILGYEAVFIGSIRDLLRH